MARVQELEDTNFDLEAAMQVMLPWLRYVRSIPVRIASVYRQHPWNTFSVGG